MFSRLFRSLVGPARDPLDKRVHRQISVIAFLAWVGVGADGLSSSCSPPSDWARSPASSRAAPRGRNLLDFSSIGP